jgi:hypothetical protein
MPLVRLRQLVPILIATTLTLSHLASGGEQKITSPNAGGRNNDSGASTGAADPQQDASVPRPSWLGIICEDNSSGKYDFDSRGVARCASKAKKEFGGFVLVSRRAVYKLKASIGLAKFLGKPVLIVGICIDNIISVDSVQLVEKKEIPGRPGGRAGAVG